MNIHLYGHGSFQKHKQDIAGWSYYALVEETGEILNDRGVVLNATSNVLAELTSITKGIQALSKLLSRNELNDATIYVHTSYKGVEAWITGEWTARNKWAKKYAAFIHNLMRKGWNLQFETIPKDLLIKHELFTKCVIDAKFATSLASANTGTNTITEGREYIPKGEPVMLPREHKHKVKPKAPISAKELKRQKKEKELKRNRAEVEEVRKAKRNQRNKKHSRRNKKKASKADNQNKSTIKEETVKCGSGTITHNPDIFVI